MSESPEETSGPVASEGLKVECRVEKACHSARLREALLACAPAAFSCSPEEGLLVPGGSWDGNHQGAFFWGLTAWKCWKKKS